MLHSAASTEHQKSELAVAAGVICNVSKERVAALLTRSGSKPYELNNETIGRIPFLKLAEESDT
jgi:hypothetical protein